MKIKSISKLAIVNGIILDGTKEMKPLEGKVILVENDMIVDIVDRKEYKHDSSYKVLNLCGKYIMPGLINMHVHLAGNGKPQKKQRDNEKLVKTIMSNPITKWVAYKLVCGFAKLELLSGVTTIRTVGGLGDFDTRCRDDVYKGKIVGPRILAANEGISVPHGHMAGSVAIAAKSIEEALNKVEESAKQRVDLIKVMVTGGVLDAKEKGVPGEMKMQGEMIKAICDKAHALGYKVAAHVESPEGVKVALENGVDSIEHGAKPNDEIMGLFAKKHAILCTTISPSIPYALFDRNVSHASEVEKYNGNIVYEGIIECSKAALKNNIPVVLGNDVGCPYVTQYDFWRELYYFSKYTGVSNAFALHTATELTAKCAGIDDRTGSISIGKCADMIVTSKNPLDDLRVLRKLDYVIAQGRLIESPRFKRKKNVDKELDKFCY